MSLAAGQRLGSYEILSLIGVGGMGEVYRARDPKLDREVAIKVLPPDVADNPERLARFRREAHVLAALNHPGIAAIHGIEDSSSILGLVMELVEGETLADMIARGGVPVGEALAMARQIADALAAAHEQGIVHRDLKPANVKVREDGTVKVLDFGLAKLTDPSAEGSSQAASMSPTMTSPAMTGVGVILGTAAYMSPEQARGRKVDARADVWAFGCVLYEMLTGGRAFEGEDVTAVLAAIIKDEPDWSALPSSLPATVRVFMQRCLEKDPKRRVRDIHDVRLALEGAFDLAEPPQKTGADWRRVLPLLAASMLVGAVAVWMLRSPAPADRGVTRTLLDVAPAERLTGNSSSASLRPSRQAVAISPDGRTIVFSGVRGTTSQLFKRALDAELAVPIPGTEGVRGPFFSPNGQWVGFWAGNKLKKVPLDGGPPVEICDVVADQGGLFGASWGSDDTIVFSAQGLGIAKVHAGGGTPSTVTEGDIEKSEGRHILPHLLPGGRVMLYTLAANLTDWEQTNIVAESLDTRHRTVLIRGAADARYIPTGHLLYMKSGTLMAVGFDPERLELKGSPVAVLDGVMQAVNPPWNADETGIGQFSVAENGTLVYVSGGIHPTSQRELVWVDRKGVASRLAVTPGPYFAPRVSPDGKRVAFHAQRERSREYVVWSYDVDRQTASRFTLDGDNCCPVWSPKSDSVVIRSVASSSFASVRVPADGTGAPDHLMSRPFSLVPTSLSPLNVLAFTEIHDSIHQIWTLALDGGGMPKPFLQSSYALMHPVFSPDGQWMAYTSTESGAQDVYVQPFPGPGKKIRISDNGGSAPAWSQDQRELFYNRIVNSMMQVITVDVDTRTGFESSKPRVLFEGPYLTNSPMRGYDVTPDGQRFVMLRRFSDPGRVEAPITQMHIVLNWTDELMRRLSVK